MLTIQGNLLKMLIKRFLFFVLLSIFGGSLTAQKTVEVELKEYKRIDKPARNEVSGIIKDPRFENVFWVLGDSGTDNKVYAINEKGEMVSGKEYEGLELEGAANRDWEDIAIDEEGNLIIADIGNNCSCRTDQSVIILKEPSAVTQSSSDYEKYDIKYQKPDGFLYRFINYSPDAESLFWKDGIIYVLSKKFKGRETRLFKLENLSTEQKNEFTLVQTIDFDDEVTAADFAFNKLAVLTYRSLWVFEQDDTPDFFDGQVTRYTFKADQVESVTFINENTVLIAEENGELYKIGLEK